MRTNGEINRDARELALLRRCADALDAIAGTLAAIGDGFFYLTPEDAAEAWNLGIGARYCGG